MNEKNWKVYKKNPRNLEKTFLEKRHINPNNKASIRQLMSQSFLPINRSEFLNQSHFNEKLTETIGKGKDIVVVEDKDADGKLAGEILTKGISDIIQQIGSRSKVYLEKTYRATGYGEISPDDIRKKHSKASLLIMSDMGITALEETDKAIADGFDVAVIDHHLPRPDKVLPHAIVVDPNQPADSFTDKAITASVISHKLLFDYCSTNDLSTLVINKLLPLAGTSIVSDVMNLIGENGLEDAPLQIGHKYVRETLKRLNQAGRPNVAPSYSVLFSALEETGKVSNGNNHVWTEDDLAMQIAPILNSASRIDDGQKSLVPFKRVSYAELKQRMLSGSTDRNEIIVPLGFRIADLPDLLLGSERISTNLNRLFANELIEVNNYRKELSKNIRDEIATSDFKKDSSNITILRNDSTPAGLIGAAAGELHEKTHNPTFYFTKDGDKLLASARGDGVKQIHDTANEMFESLYKRKLFDGGGHAMAIGTSADVKDAKNVEKFLKQAANTITIENEKPISDVAVNKLSTDDIESLNKYAPFGQGFPPLSIVLNGTKITKVNFMGRKKNHIKLSTASGIDILFFNQSKEQLSNDNFQVGKRIWVKGTPKINEFNERISLQLIPEANDVSFSPVNIQEEGINEKEDIGISR